MYRRFPHKFSSRRKELVALVWRKLKPRGTSITGGILEVRQTKLREANHMLAQKLSIEAGRVGEAQRQMTSSSRRGSIVFFKRAAPWRNRFQRAAWLWHDIRRFVSVEIRDRG